MDQDLAVERQYKSFVAEVIMTVHRAIATPGIRNALADAGNNVGLRIPTEVVPQSKEVNRMLVLGTRKNTAQLIQAPRKEKMTSDPDDVSMLS